MNLKALPLIIILIIFIGNSSVYVEFPKNSGFIWEIKEGNGWNTKNVWVDEKGLHLVSSAEGNAGIFSKDSFSLGVYIFYFEFNLSNIFLNLSIGKAIIEIISNNFTSIKSYIKDIKCFKEFKFDFTKYLTLFIKWDLLSFMFRVYQGIEDPFRISSNIYNECFFQVNETKFKVEMNLIYLNANSEIILKDFKFFPSMTTQTVFITQTTIIPIYETLTVIKNLTIYFTERYTETKNITITQTQIPLDPLIVISLIFTVILALFSYFLIIRKK
mgnify:CR=1 FL=1|jgi:hypothetical protein